MRPGASEAEFLVSHSVDQKPVRFDMDVAIALPIAFQRMIFIGRRKLSTCDQKLQDQSQLA